MTDDGLSDVDQERLSWISHRLNSLAGARLVQPLDQAGQAEWDELSREQKALLDRRERPEGCEQAT